MAFIYDRQDETVIEYDPIARIKFLAGVPDNNGSKHRGGYFFSGVDDEVKETKQLREYSPEEYFRSVEHRQHLG